MTIPDRVVDRIADVLLSAHLATSVDDRPHAAPIWYADDDGSPWVSADGGTGARAEGVDGERSSGLVELRIAGATLSTYRDGLAGNPRFRR